MPLLLLTQGTLSAPHVTAISLGAVLFNAISGTVAYARQRRIDYRSGLLMAVSTMPTAALGAWAVAFVPRRPFAIVFGIFLMLAAVFVFVRPAGRQVTSTGPGRMTCQLTDAKNNAYQWTFDLRLGMAASFVVGFVAALLGVGGGIMLVPIMVSVLGFPAAVATATSTFILVFTAASATATHAVQGDFAGLEVITAVVAVGMIVGAQIGARLSLRLTGKLIVRMLAVGLAVVGLRLLLSGLS